MAIQETVCRVRFPRRENCDSGAGAAMPSPVTKPRLEKIAVNDLKAFMRRWPTCFHIYP